MKRLLLAVVLGCSTMLWVAAVSAEDSTKSPSSIQTQMPVPTPATATVAASMKIAYVDLQKVGSDSRHGKAMKARLQGRKDKLQSQVDGKRKGLERMRAGIEAKLPSLSPAQRTAKAKDFEKKMEEFQEFGRKAEKELVELQERESGEFFAAIEKAAAAIGKDKGYSLVIVRREVLYLASGVDTQDATQDVITLLDQEMK